MIGAILGDIVGSRFEFDNVKSKDFAFLTPECFATDDSLMTLAVASAILRRQRGGGDLSELAIAEMQRIGRAHPECDYGGMFGQWLLQDCPRPYNSWGNGAAMRVSPCGFAATSLDEALWLAESVTWVTHDHPEGLKGAAATTAAIFLARTGCGKSAIRKYIESNYYSLGFNLDGIRPTYRFDESCAGTVPQAIVAFLESTSYEDAIRNAVSIGGDSDTLAAITGGIAEAFYGGEGLEALARPFIPQDVAGIVDDFRCCLGRF